MCALLAAALLTTNLGVTLLMTYAITTGGPRLTSHDKAGPQVVAVGDLVGAGVWALVLAHQVSVDHGGRGHRPLTAAVVGAWLHLTVAVAFMLDWMTAVADVGIAWLAVLNAAVPLPATHCIRRARPAASPPGRRTLQPRTVRPAAARPHWADLLAQQPVTAGYYRSQPSRTGRAAPRPVRPRTPASPPTSRGDP